MRLAKTFEDIELAFIREFAHGELYRLASMSPLERQERIRVAIMAAGIQDKPFDHTGITYAQSYRMAYKKACEQRRYPRDAAPMVLADESDEEEEPVS